MGLFDFFLDASISVMEKVEEAGDSFFEKAYSAVDEMFPCEDEEITEEQWEEFQKILTNSVMEAQERENKQNEKITEAKKDLDVTDYDFWNKFWGKLNRTPVDVNRFNVTLNKASFGIDDAEVIWFAGESEYDEGIVFKKTKYRMDYVITDHNVFICKDNKLLLKIRNNDICEVLVLGGKLLTSRESYRNISNECLNTIVEMQKALSNSVFEKEGKEKLFNETIHYITNGIHNDKSIYVYTQGEILESFLNSNYGKAAFKTYLRVLLLSGEVEERPEYVADWISTAEYKSLIDEAELENEIRETLLNELADYSSIGSYEQAYDVRMPYSYDNRKYEKILELITKYATAFDIISGIKRGRLKNKSFLKKYNCIKENTLADKTVLQKYYAQSFAQRNKFYVDQLKQNNYVSYPFERGALYGIDIIRLSIMVGLYNRIDEFAKQTALSMKQNKLVTMGINLGLSYYEGEKKSTMLEDLFDYRVICGLKGEWDYVEKLYIYTDEYNNKAKSLEDLKKKLKFAKTANAVEKGAKYIGKTILDGVAQSAERTINNTSRMVSERSDYLDDSRYDEYQDKISESRDALDNFKSVKDDFSNSEDLSKSSLENLTEAVCELENDINTLKKNSRSEIEDRIRVLKNSSDPFIRTILAVFDDYTLLFNLEKDTPLFIEYDGVQFCVSKELYEEKKQLCESIDTIEDNTIRTYIQEQEVTDANEE